MKKQIEIIVPESWSDVTLERYQDYSTRVKGLDDEDEIVLNSISSLCGVPIEVIKRLKISDIKILYTKLGKLISVPVNKEVLDLSLIHISEPTRPY